MNYDRIDRFPIYTDELRNYVTNYFIGLLTTQVITPDQYNLIITDSPIPILTNGQPSRRRFAEITEKYGTISQYIFDAYLTYLLSPEGLADFAAYTRDSMTISTRNKVIIAKINPIPQYRNYFEYIDKNLNNFAVSPQFKASKKIFTDAKEMLQFLSWFVSM